MVREVEEREVALKVLPFIQAFSHKGRINFITQKGLMYWQPTLL